MKEIGIVKNFNISRGRGVIGREDGSDVPVYVSAILGGGLRTLKPGQRVEFTAGEGSKGPEALEVEIL